MRSETKTEILIYTIFDSSLNAFDDIEQKKDETSTFIEIFEKTTLYRYNNTRQYIPATEGEEGAFQQNEGWFKVIEDEETLQDTTVLSDNTLTLPEYLQDVKPTIITDNNILDTIAMMIDIQYKDRAIQNKRIKLKYNYVNTSDNYDIPSSFISVLIKYNYIYFDFDIANKKIYWPKTQIMLNAVNINHALVILEDTGILTINHITFTECSFFGIVSHRNENNESAFIPFNITVKNKISFVSCKVLSDNTGDLITFNIANKNDNMTKWINSECFVKQLEYHHANLVFKSLSTSLIKINGFKSVKVYSSEIHFKEISGIIFDIKKVNDFMLIAVNCCATEVKRTIVALHEVANSTVAQCDIKQLTKFDPKIEPKPLPYFIVYHGGSATDNHKIVSTTVESVGVASFVNANIGNATIVETSLKYFKDPFRFKKSVIDKIVFMDNEYIEVESLEISANNISIFNGDIKLSRLKIDVYDKFYTSGMVLIIDQNIDVTFNSLDASFIADNSTLRAQKLKVTSEEDHLGRISATASRFECDEISITNINKTSLDECEIQTKLLTIDSKTITQFKTRLNYSRLDSINIMSNKIVSCDVSFAAKIHKPFDTNIVNTRGNLIFRHYGGFPRQQNLLLDNSAVHVEFVCDSPSEDTTVNLECIDKCQGSKILALDHTRLKIRPKVNTTHNDLFFTKSLAEFNSPKTNKLIAYGIV